MTRYGPEMNPAVRRRANAAQQLYNTYFRKNKLGKYNAEEMEALAKAKEEQEKEEENM